MLRLKDIRKTYESGGVNVPALKGINLNFRQSEFVSILGQSGCGKTTLLNIIGGLDRYTSGDLIIVGKSTKDYTDKDWDSYRNHTIGFVFQNYNLIMHLNILDNVEMALALAGLNREERKQKAIDALKRVGLGDHLHKRPSQLSGGQMQRVAIARAIVNHPKIILADEPTGALDTETSIQIMEILKELSKDKLIIMVTHNPELAEQYSTRIVRVLDGEVKSDSMPFSEEDEIAEINALQSVVASCSDSNLANENKIINKSTLNETANANVAENESVNANEENVNENNVKANKGEEIVKPKAKKKGQKTEKTSMSFFTALKLSLQNLRTKKTRTILTSIAGSIGIIGVALILALSNGFQAYVNKMQMDTLSNYPLTIERTATDYNSLADAFGKANSDKNGKLDKIYVNKVMEKLKSLQRNNNITEEYIENVVKTIDSDLYYDIQYLTDLKLNIYKKTTYNELPIYQDVNAMSGSYSGMGSVWSELVSNKDFIQSQYDLVYGAYPQDPTSESMDKEHQIVLILNANNQISDIMLSALGLPYAEDSYSYADFVGQEFKVLSNDKLYSISGDNVTKNKVTKDLYDSGITLKIVGILRLNDNSSMGSISGAVAYLPSLSNYMLNLENQSNLVAWQKAHKEINAKTGEAFTGSDDEKEQAYQKALRVLGADKTPSQINISPVDFKAKEQIKEHLDNYHATKENEEDKVYYTDLMEIMVSTINTVISAISYVLIAFTSVSLVVSSLMIGIITYVSVLERIKEIGILRSIGARKKDISRVFNAETLIIGFCAGLIGVIVTLMLSIPINIILYALVDIPNMCALPAISAVVLILISMGLTLISGLIPARIASKKDPVIALRSE